MKKIYLFICLFVYLFIPASARAAGEFQADYDVNYAVSPSGTTIVTQNVNLTNKLTNLYPKQYNIVIDSDKIKNIIASDGGGLITPQVVLKDGKTDITVTFNEKVVGIGKTLNFSLRYEHNDIAHKNGRIWEVNVPGVEGDPDLGRYRVSLSVPPSFGPVAYLSPQPAYGAFWNKDQMVRGGISAAYGKNQLFDFTLHYYLENTSVTARQTEIALPPNTAYQTVSVDSLDPAPSNVVVDEDGNWLARYTLSPNQKVNAVAAVRVSVFLYPKSDWTTKPPASGTYTKPLRYWDSFDPKIIDLAKKYHTPKDIYDFVVSTLTYGYGRVNQNPIRRGALGAFTNPKDSICMEFTDLFIALARANGIAARENVGFAYTTNSKLRPLSLVSDVLHSWPEYYDSERSAWIPVDPTWANTTGGVDYFNKLDFNHVVFAIHGHSSDYPYPAGFYKDQKGSSKDVLVSFGETELETNPSVTSRIEFPKVVSAGISTSGTVVVQNTGSSTIPSLAISVQSSPGGVNLNTEYTDIPPFGTKTIPITLLIDNWFVNGQGRIVVTANSATETQSFQIQPLYVRALPFVVSITVVTLALLFVSQRRKLWIFKRH